MVNSFNFDFAFKMQSLTVVLDRVLETKISELLSPNSTRDYGSGLLIGHRAESSIHVVHLARTLQLDASAGDEVSAF